MSPEHDIPLAEFIASLRTELERAQKEGDGHELRFGIGPIDLELEVVASREGGGQAGVRFWVVSLGASGKLASATTQRIKLQLTPRGRDGRPLEVAEDRLTSEPR